MTVALNEDIFTLIYSHIFDFEVFRTTTIAVAVSKQHPLRNVILRRILQLPLRLSSEDLNDSKALIDHLVRKPAHADLVKNLTVVLGPSRKTIAEHERFGEEVLPEDLEQAERAEALVALLPELLRCTENLQHLDWSRSPPPSREALKELSEHSRITHLSLDCSVESYFIPDPSKPLEVPDTTANIKPLFSTVGPKVTSLDLRNVDEDVFKAIQEDFPPLKNVRNLKLDLACGVWDWDGAGSPQLGPTEHYRFPRISNNVQELEILITDLLARQRKGPVQLVDPMKLTKLRVNVIPCFNWISIEFVRLFSDFTPADFSSLTHLVIDDSIRDMRRWAIGGTMGRADWQESGRTYTGIHELISSLPQLRHLWTNERVLAVPTSDNRDDVWDAKPFDGESNDAIMTHTAASPQWELLGHTFEKLESLRVGFGPLNAGRVTKVLSLCDHAKLKAFGFDWEWQPGSNKPGVFSELIETLSKFESLADLHILHPYAALHTPIDYSRSPDLRLTVRRLHESEETEARAKELLSTLPGLYRVGMGRNSVWERQTRWKEYGADEFHVQRLHRARVPSFYDAGSSLPLTNLGEGDKRSAIGDVLMLLKEL